MSNYDYLLICYNAVKHYLLCECLLEIQVANVVNVIFIFQAITD